MSERRALPRRRRPDEHVPGQRVERGLPPEPLGEFRLLERGDAFFKLDAHRVDFFLPRNGGELVINELNTMPGLTEVSGYPKMWAASGLSFGRLLETLIELAFERHREKSLTKTSR